jgi:hypothetical protein
VKPSALAWVRLNSVPVIRAARPGIVRQFVGSQVGHGGKLKSIDDLEPNIITDLNARMSKLSNSDLEGLFLEYLKGSR